MKKKIKEGLVGLLIGASALTGCAEFNEYDAAGLAFRHLAPYGETPAQRLAAKAAGEAFTMAGQRRHDLNVAIEGRDQIYIVQGQNQSTIPENVIFSNGRYHPAPGYTWANLNDPRDLRTVPKQVRETPQDFVKFFACNYAKDFDNDGVSEYPDEFVGIKNRFRKDERIILVSYLKAIGIKGRECNLKVYSPRGEVVSEDKHTLLSDLIGRWFGDISGPSYANLLVERGGLGSYKAAWYLDGKLAGMTEFEIVE